MPTAASTDRGPRPSSPWPARPPPDAPARTRGYQLAGTSDAVKAAPEAGPGISRCAGGQIACLLGRRRLAGEVPRCAQQASVGRCRWSAAGRPWQGPQPRERGQQRRCPRPVAVKAEDDPAGMADEPSGRMPQPGAQGLGLGDLEVSVQQQRLRPAHSVCAMATRVSQTSLASKSLKGRLRPQRMRSSTRSWGRWRPWASMAGCQAPAGAARMAALTSASIDNPVENSSLRPTRSLTKAWVAPAVSARTRIGPARTGLGSASSAIASTSMWSWAVLEPALPGRKLPLNASRCRRRGPASTPAGGTRSRA